MSNSYYDQSLILRWGRGEPTEVPAPLAVRSRWYRRLIAATFERCLPAGSRRILSLGSGTGRAEAFLADQGFDIVASDIDADAIRLCRQVGLVAAYYDILAAPASLGRFDGLYADGLLGHLPTMRELERVWRHGRELTSGHFVLSNDLADSDARIDRRVHGNSRARFHRPPAGAFARSATRSGLWRAIWSRILLYQRPGRGLRRRELLVLQAVIGGRTDERGGH